FNDPGVSWMFVNLCRLLREKGGQSHFSPSSPSEQPGATNKKDTDPISARCDCLPQLDTSLKEPRATVLIPGQRVRYLAEIAEQGRGINTDIERQAEVASRAQSYYDVLKDIDSADALPKILQPYDASVLLAGKGGDASGDRSLLT